MNERKIIDREPVALLLSLVADPLAMADELERKDRQRLAKRSEMNDRGHPAWDTLDEPEADRGLAAYRLLARRPVSAQLSLGR